ncbi:MAG: V-type ATPase 116kDa subunit family protein [Caldilineaceae bacterium]
MLLRMAKIQIIGAKNLQQPTVRVLQRLGVIQIEPWRSGRAQLQQGITLDETAVRQRERLVYLLTRVDAILAALPSTPALADAAFSAEIDKHDIAGLLQAVESIIVRVEPDLQTLTQERHHLEEQLSALPRCAATLRQLLPLSASFTDTEHCRVAAVLVERRYAQALQCIIEQLNIQTQNHCEVLSRPIDTETIGAILIFPKSAADVVGQLLSRENIAQVRLPPEFAGQSFEQALSNIEQRLQEIPPRLAQIDAALAQLAQAWRARLQIWRMSLSDALDQIDICAHFGATDYTFVIEGWAPETRLTEIETALAREVGDELVLVRLPLDAEEQQQAPIVLENRALARPFEPLVKLLALPRYGGYDPTSLMSFFLPLFFGMILGDIAYGIILLIVMYFFCAAALSTTPCCAAWPSADDRLAVEHRLWFCLYGEFLGAFGEELGIHPLWFDRGSDVESLFLMTIALKPGHILLGMVLGVGRPAPPPPSSHCRKNGHADGADCALFAHRRAGRSAAGVFADAGGGAAAGGAGHIDVHNGAARPAIRAAGGGGRRGQHLVLLRIAAVGLASVYLAQVANEMVGAVGNVFVGLIICHAAAHRSTLCWAPLAPPSIAASALR